MVVQSHAGTGCTYLNMKVTFRTDASIQMGIGHVMRCLTLADALAVKGAQCNFICREHEGNLIQHIQSKGYRVHRLPMGSEADTDLAHSAWLGATQEQDSQACASFLAELQPDWLVVDHYALDARWEAVLAEHCRQVMVIDDLADRQHACHMLLDQTFGRSVADYWPFVPEGCSLLCGSSYALLRPEFAALRPYSLQRRAQPKLKNLLITMGGVDKDNVTAQVLAALRDSPLSADCKITVVMGATAPWLADVQQKAQNMPWPTTVCVGVTDMAQLMADSDLAIGAAGATTWERCCLGLPTIMLVLAKNQLKVAQGLEQAGLAAKVTSGPNADHQISSLLGTLASSPNRLHAMSRSSAHIVDGMGTSLVTAMLESQYA
jgi:UDP-2,4-diacetamido-2,4,6-trideoxy-beta-L-altropyranose hydrolase